MMDYKEILGLIAVLICFYAYILYFKSIFMGETKPHLFSFLIWGTSSGIACVGQVSGSGGAGAWVTGFVSICCFAVALLSFKYGEKNITRFDWGCLITALSAIPLWILTQNALAAILVVTFIDCVGYVPTFRKSWPKPYEEHVAAAFLSSLQYVFSFFALNAYSLLTCITPISLMIINGALGIMLVLRRKQMDTKKAYDFS
jgi:hypothetical protein